MKERSEKLIEQKAKDDAIMNFVSYQAQEAILNPNMEDDYKDWIVNAAVRKIDKIAERRIAYDVGHSESERLKRSHIIYEAEGNEKERRKTLR